MKIAIGFDHGGVALRQAVIEVLDDLGHDVVDFGTDDSASVDYADYANSVADAVVSGECDRGILACGTGIGMSIAANKVRGCYAALLSDCFSARMAGEHNAANVACLGGRTIGTELAKAIIESYLNAQPDRAERHQRRRDKVCSIEAGSAARSDG
jgi:ribose 5-phosphate isomerase B